MISPSEIPVDDGLDEEQQAVVDTPKEPTRTNTGRKKYILLALIILVCVVVVGVLAARPWRPAIKINPSSSRERKVSNNIIRISSLPQAPKTSTSTMASMKRTALLLRPGLTQTATSNPILVLLTAHSRTGFVI